MKEFIKNHIKYHLNNLWIYVDSILLMFIGFLVSAFSEMAFQYNHPDSPFKFVLSSLIFSIISTPLLIKTNMKAAKGYIANNPSPKKTVIQITVLNQCVSISIFFIITYILMNISFI